MWPVDLDQDRQWIAGLRAGQLSVFQAIFDAYALRLRQFACVWVPSDTAEDIVQDVMFDLWRRRSELHIQNENLAAYLFSAVRNRAMTVVRHEAMVERVHHDRGLSNIPGMGEVPMALDDQAITNEFYVALAEGISRLSELQRAVLMLRWTQGLSYADIGTTLSISENAAMHHMSRARSVLRPLLSHYLGEMT